MTGIADINKRDVITERRSIPVLPPKIEEDVVIGRDLTRNTARDTPLPLHQEEAAVLTADDSFNYQRI